MERAQGAGRCRGRPPAAVVPGGGGLCRHPSRAGAGNRSQARRDNPILVKRFGGKDRNCRSSCVVRDEQSRSDVGKAAARLAAAGAKGRAARGRGGVKRLSVGRRGRGEASARYRPREESLRPRFENPQRNGEGNESSGCCTAGEVTSGTSSTAGVGGKDRKLRFSWKNACRWLSHCLRVSVPSPAYRKRGERPVCAELPVAPRGAARAPAPRRQPPRALLSHPRDAAGSPELCGGVRPPAPAC